MKYNYYQKNGIGPIAGAACLGDEFADRIVCVILINDSVKPVIDLDAVAGQSAFIEQSLHEHMKLLLVEDSHRLQRSLGAGLRNSGFVLDQAFDGEEAWAFLRESEYDIVILDLMIPKIDGLTLLSKLRHAGNQAQVIILSARDTTQDRITGLDAGADDYLVKPFSFDELLSRLRALSRRPRETGASLDPQLQIDGVVIDLKDRMVFFNRGPIVLTPSEYSILALLAQRRGQIHTHDQLIDRLYDSTSDVTRNAIEAHVSALRRKLRNAGAPALVENRRGFGYFIAAKSASAAGSAE